ncbi:MAG: low temperature requirement protein A [Eubacterium sp.]|nr:low temperature requirement protein A [Eubacterium sp.]
MIGELIDKKEKKVEYIELIYDLIFVYVIGRNNAILQNVDGGFVSARTFLSYALCTLAIIQVWNFSTFYINMFGKNGVREHIFMFINMYLLYFIGQSTRTDWADFQSQYHIAWGLILINIGVQYIIELKNHGDNAANRDIIKRMCIALFTEAVLVFIAAIPVPELAVSFSALAIVSGIVLTAFGRHKSDGGQIDFPHLTERAMLYVVFTFGEMIIALASYFTGDGSFNRNTIYFSLMAFLIVVGLFLSYGFVYDNLIDREGDFDGMLYMVIHIFIIFAMNNITASLEFMREEEVHLVPKLIFLVCSVVAYFVFLFALKRYAKCTCKPTKPFMLKAGGLTAAFAVLMAVFRENMAVNISVSAIYVFSLFALLYATYKDIKKNS